jgi:hypothetical protein
LIDPHVTEPFKNRAGSVPGRRFSCPGQREIGDNRPVTALSATATIARIALVIASLVVVALLLGRGQPRQRTLVERAEYAQVLARVATTVAEARAVRCPRAALREPATGDASAVLHVRLGHDPADKACFDQLFTRGRESCPEATCPVPSISSVTADPELVEQCAPLYAAIAEVAHASEACSPVRLGMVDPLDNDSSYLAILSVPDAVRLQIVPLVARGELGAAARHVADAMRFVDDYGRQTPLLSATFSLVAFESLADTLAELLVDPRLAVADARAIARDLEVLRATMPDHAGVLRQEWAWSRAFVARSGAIDDLTGDREQDLAIVLLGIERAHDRFERLCHDAAIADCLARLGPLGTPVAHTPDFAREVASEADDATVRERLIELYASWGEFAWSYLPELARREYTLTALAIQAELRIAGLEACLDPERLARLARWHGARLTDELALQLPAHVATARPSRGVRCVEPAGP